MGRYQGKEEDKMAEMNDCCHIMKGVAPKHDKVRKSGRSV